MKEQVIGSCEPAGGMVHPAVIIQPARLGNGAERADSEWTAPKEAALEPRTVEKGYGFRHMDELITYEQMFDTMSTRPMMCSQYLATGPKTTEAPPPWGDGASCTNLISGLRPY